MIHLLLIVIVKTIQMFVLFFIVCSSQHGHVVAGPSFWSGDVKTEERSKYYKHHTTASSDTPLPAGKQCLLIKFSIPYLAIWEGLYFLPRNATPISSETDVSDAITYLMQTRDALLMQTRAYLMQTRDALAREVCRPTLASTTTTPTTTTRWSEV